MKTKKYIWIAISACFLAVALAILVGLRRGPAFELRKQDLRTLSQAYLQAPTNIESIEQLLTLLASNKVRLHNPIPKDPSSPCYRLVRSSDSVPRILIEETNTTDTRYVFVAGMDGSIFARRKK